MKSLLEPMDSTLLNNLLDDWFQPLESSQYGWRPEGVQVVFSAENPLEQAQRWGLVQEVTIKMGFKVVVQEQNKENGAAGKK